MICNDELAKRRIEISDVMRRLALNSAALLYAGHIGQNGHLVSAIDHLNLALDDLRRALDGGWTPIDLETGQLQQGRKGR